MNLCELTYNTALKFLLNDKLIKSYKIDNYGQYYWELKNYEYSRINNSISYYHHNLTFTIVNKLKTEDWNEYFKALAFAFELAVQSYITKSHAKDYIAVYVSHPSLEESIYLKLKRIRDFKKKDFVDKLGDIQYSHEKRRKILENGEIKVEIVIYKYESINSL